jgi:hypothetical protein
MILFFLLTLMRVAVMLVQMWRCRPLRHFLNAGYYSNL